MTVPNLPCIFQPSNACGADVRGAVFWVILAAVLAVVTHFSYVLFVPSRSFENHLASILASKGSNTFVILDPSQQASLLPYATEDDLVGLCSYDVRKGAVLINAHVPRSFWTFAVYTNRGRQIYAINDTQAGGEDFKMELSPAKSFFAQLTAGADDQDTSGVDAGWRVSVNESQGIAVLWVPQGDAIHRASAAAIVQSSRCGISDN